MESKQIENQLKDSEKPTKNESDYKEEFEESQLQQKGNTDTNCQIRTGQCQIDKKQYDLVYYKLQKEEEEHNLEIKKSILKITQVRHTNIVRYHEIFQWTDKEETINIIIKQEYTHKNLEQILFDNKSKLSDWQCLTGLYNIHDALFYMYKKFKLHHGNINPSNILVQNNVWKLSEFYHSQESVASEKIKLKASSLTSSYYHSPELTQAIEMAQNLTQIDLQKEDIWSLGMILCRSAGKLTEEQIKLFNKNDGDVKKGMIKVKNQFWNFIIQKMCTWKSDERCDLVELKKLISENGTMDKQKEG